MADKTVTVVSKHGTQVTVPDELADKMVASGQFTRQRPARAPRRAAEASKDS